MLGFSDDMAEAFVAMWDHLNAERIRMLKPLANVSLRQPILKPLFVKR